MATTTHAPMPANEAGLLIRMSSRERDTILDALRIRLETLDRERDQVSQAIAAVRLSTVG